jgi:hypothetical protein
MIETHKLKLIKEKREGEWVIQKVHQVVCSYWS